MCGIAGTIRKGAGRADEMLSEHLPAILRRGPDAHGVKTFDCRGHTIGLAHTRLSVIDLSELGHQPMHDPVSGWWITYNGEIYNYVELREDLQRLGWSFRSGSDSEVLLKAWAQWGLDALSRFNGMFAFAALHCPSGQVWLVRDRFGVKPLCWGRTQDGAVAFSSSVAGIAFQAGAEVDLDYCARGARYKVFETAQSGSPFQNVKSVPAGGWVRFQLSDNVMVAEEGRWYDLKSAVDACAQSILTSGDDELVARCRHMLESAVRLRLRSDVPVAVSLSGGLDSTAIAALAARKVKKLAGFTYGSPSAAASEGPQVQEFAGTLDIDVSYVWPESSPADLCAALDRTLAFQEAPFAGLSPIAQNEVFRAVRTAGYKVLLGGQGADEVFAGYRKFFIVALREALHAREPASTVRLLYSFGLMLLHEGRQARLYWENRHRYWGKAEASFRLLDWKPPSENLLGSPRLTVRQIDDVQQWSLPTLLRYEDRNSMGYGVESRLPFMDYRLVELALALPARLKLRHGFGKWALREASARVVPDSIRLNRLKRGFDVTQSWLSEGMGAGLRARIFDQRTALAGHLRPGADLDHLLSDASLAADSNLLCEALMLAWLARPVRPPVADHIGKTHREKDLSFFVGP
ncbi:MAG TPA: asparagine synthase (glutamine-hydrolyzing) [Noviherbaspirillum sp.]|uniref:asparagine synthase (glutamine-hydrolyzing) n=1 Tax=Noviherbaspirillum sp. TaxID=1926288 RepID=UPI002B4A61DC|nr:asparagine synthase (glutamine-hydrolyzing) [Noviherbaspirillum sp.]HJV84453.1 asparagine synthase (glutamine-hydrolyzing) [Noviherbaspirillum sp.]